MDQLSSCYFCGGALDVSLSEYPVVPTELRAEGEDSKTVVLCSTCRQKLATVVEEVVAASESEPEIDESEFQPITTSESDTEDEATAFEPGAADDSEASATDGDSLFAEEDTESGDTDEGGSGLLGDDGSSERTTTDETTTDEVTTDRTKTETTTSDASSSAETASESGDDGPTLTRLEYNKVMRLLQNREFPVDRMEIREVATSAYQISPEEFDTVIDAAIERDLIAERNGQFVDPDERQG